MSAANANRFAKILIVFRSVSFRIWILGVAIALSVAISWLLLKRSRDTDQTQALETTPTSIETNQRKTPVIKPVQNLTKKPHIILINLDDADREMFRPEIRQERFPAIDRLAKAGMTFSNFHVTSPLCGPSRACLLRGQYAHSISHRTNTADGLNTRGFGGDYNTFFDKGYADDDMGTWMKEAGYQTIFVGKYVNLGSAKKRVPAGWDDFYQSHGSRYYETCRFTNRRKPKGKSERLPKGIYRTKAETDDVIRLIEERSESEKPLFVYFAPLGPHSQGRAPGGMIDNEFNDQWKAIEQPIDEDFNEIDFSDKPHSYRNLTRLSTKSEKSINRLYRDRMLAVRSVDDAVQRIVNVLKKEQMLEDTYIFITSDNGYTLGQHRMTGKGSAFSLCAHVPMVVYGPGVSSGVTADHLLGHIDLGPTFLELAGSQPKPFHDGKSFTQLLNAPESCDAGNWRDGLIIENWQTKYFEGKRLDATFCQLRMPTAIYTEWADGSREFYDLEKDPFELTNRYSSLTAKQAQSFSKRLKMLRTPQTLPIATLEGIYSLDFQTGSGHFLVKGVAEDSSGIESVSVTIQNVATNQFWDGKEWQSSTVKIRANLANPDGIQTEWQIPIIVDGDQISNVVASPIARAGNGRVSAIESHHLTRDDRPPSTEILKVAVPNSGNIHIEGRALDNDRVANVQVHIQNLEDGSFFDGTRWVHSCQSLRCQTDAENRWEIKLSPLTEGRYVVRAQAVDGFGNSDRRIREKEFSVIR